ncbi:hypothetical protein ABTH33_20155, partial [Acinetobacter baumannii]
WHHAPGLPDETNSIRKNRSLEETQSQQGPVYCAWGCFRDFSLPDPNGPGMMAADASVKA